MYIYIYIHGRKVGGSLGAINAPLPRHITKILIFYYNEAIALFLKQLQANFKHQRIFQCHKRK